MQKFESNKYFFHVHNYFICWCEYNFQRTWINHDKGRFSFKFKYETWKNKMQSAQNVGFMKLYYENMEKKKKAIVQDHTLDW